MEILTRQISVQKTARFFASFFLVAALFIPSAAFAAMFETNGFPFNSANLVPGASVSGTITFNNTTGAAQTAAIEAVSITDPSELGKQMTLTISDGSTNFFSSANGTFYDFLTGGSLSLGSMAIDASKTYTFALSFSAAAPNAFQNKTLGFDLCIGFLGNTVQCGQTVISPQQPGGGDSGASGGGGGGLTLLVISNVDVASFSVVNGTATIEWDTNRLATSQVIFGLAAAAPYILDINNLPNFGYPSGTSENETKIFHHVVNLAGLTSGETYVYRVVSRASPPTISSERRFTLALARLPGENLPLVAASEENPIPSGSATPGSSSGGQQGITGNGGTTTDGENSGDAATTTPEGSVEAASTTDQGDGSTSANNQAAAAFLGIPDFLRRLFTYEIFTYVWPVLLVLFAGWVILWFRRRRR